MALAQIIGIFTLLLVGVAMFPVIVSETNAALNNSEIFNNQANLTAGSSSAETMLKTVPAFFAISFLLVIVAMVWKALRNAGVIGRSSDEFDSGYDVDGDGEISEEEETLKALEEGQEDEVEEAEREERNKAKPRKKTKYELRAEQIEQETEAYKQRADNSSTDIASVDYHNNNKVKKKSGKEKDPYLEDFGAEDAKDKEDSFTKKGRFD